MKIALSLLVILSLACIPICAKDKKDEPELTIIRGKVVGFTSISPALLKEIEAKYGKKPDKDPESMGPNVHVGKHSVTYVSPYIEKSKGK